MPGAVWSAINSVEGFLEVLDLEPLKQWEDAVSLVEIIVY